MHIFTVQTLTQAIKDILEGEFPFVWVRGQVSNLSRPPSGHVYFTLKDHDAIVNVVWFKGAQPLVDEGERINPLTGEVEIGPGLVLENDLEVLVAGHINVYPPRGGYQLVAELVQEKGLGELAVAFEALKTKLAAQGYFDPDRKLAIPSNPRQVAVITAPQGAALQDFLRIAKNRGFGSTIRVYPSLMQGEAAPAQIAAALDLVDQENWAQVIVLIRGGGSLEDLWAFNTEVVATAMFQARLPIITGVGHEVDTTIADFIADERAATPTHAAQILWTERDALKQQVDEAFLDLSQVTNHFVMGYLDHLTAIQQALLWNSPTRRIERDILALDSLFLRLEHAMETFFQDHAQDFSRSRDGLLQAFGPLTMAQMRAGVDKMSTALHRAGLDFIQGQLNVLGSTHMDLVSLDPLAPLARGYALVSDGQGRFVRSYQQVSPGDELQVRVYDGEFDVEVSL